jgi:IS30 family transposase
LIEERPEQANSRGELGHWERDLLIGQVSGPALLVIQDRTSRYVIIRKVLNKTCAEVNRVTIEALKRHKVCSTTNDNGSEFREYESLEAKLNAPVFFCHPYTSSERGTVENTNGLIRQYFPKGHDFNKVSEEDIQFVENAINKRPRKILGYRSAYEVHEEKTLKLVLSEKTYRRMANSREQASYIQDIVRQSHY